jgi:hypothetical protein
MKSISTKTNMIASIGFSLHSSSMLFTKSGSFGVIVDGSFLVGEPLLLPQRFRQNRAWIELKKIWRTKKKVKGFQINKIEGGFWLEESERQDLYSLRYRYR